MFDLSSSLLCRNCFLWVILGWSEQSLEFLQLFQNLDQMWNGESKGNLHGCGLFLQCRWLHFFSHGVLCTPCQRVTQMRWSLGTLPFPGTLAGVKGCDHLTLVFFLSFFEQDQCLNFRCSHFQVMPPGSCHWSVVPCLSFHPEEVLLYQRIHTSIKLKLRWPEPASQEGSPVLWPTVELRRRHLEWPK